MAPSPPPEVAAAGAVGAAPAAEGTFTFTSSPSSNNSHAASLQRMRTAMQQLKQEVFNLKYVLQLNKDEAALLRRTADSLHEEVNRLKDMYDACQDDLLDYDELKESFETTKKELQSANMRIYHSSTREKLAHAKLQSCKAAMLNLSEQSARSTIMWAEEADRLKSLHASAVADLEDARDTTAACCACKHSRIERALVPCGHCVCARCSDSLSTCPACRCMPVSKLKLFV